MSKESKNEFKEFVAEQVKFFNEQIDVITTAIVKYHDDRYSVPYPISEISKQVFIEDFIEEFDRQNKIVSKSDSKITVFRL